MRDSSLGADSVVLLDRLRLCPEPAEAVASEEERLMMAGLQCSEQGKEHRKAVYTQCAKYVEYGQE